MSGHYARAGRGGEGCCVIALSPGRPVERLPVLPPRVSALGSPSTIVLDHLLVLVELLTSLVKYLLSLVEISCLGGCI